MAEGRIRIDKWLWAARFFKTRSLASEAVAGGRVHIEGQRVKPARDVRLGEQVQITVGDVTTTVVVEALSDRRGPASQAVLLYRETGESRERRERERELRRLAPPPGADMRGRPGKRDRRRLEAQRAGMRRGGAPHPPTDLPTDES
jgi:ribosome-associated heat shock protein Hsp15